MFFRGLREALHSTPNQGLLSQTTLATAGGHRAISVHVEHESQICIKFPFYVPPIILIFCFFNLSLALSFASISEVFFHLVGYGTPPPKIHHLNASTFCRPCVSFALSPSPTLTHTHTACSVMLEFYPSALVPLHKHHPPPRPKEHSCPHPTLSDLSLSLSPYLALVPC